MTAQTAFRIVHILAGICWVGGAVFIAMFLLPAARSVGPASGAIIREINAARKLPVFLALMSWSTIISGCVLAWRDAGPLGMRWFESGTGLVLGIGATLGIIAGLGGMLISAPTAGKMAKLGGQIAREQREPTPQESATIQGFQDRLYNTARVLMVVLLLASAAMASARYM